MNVSNISTGVLLKVYQDLREIIRKKVHYYYHHCSNPPDFDNYFNESKIIILELLEFINILADEIVKRDDGTLDHPEKVLGIKENFDEWLWLLIERIKTLDPIYLIKDDLKKSYKQLKSDYYFKEQDHVRKRG